MSLNQVLNAPNYRRLCELVEKEQVNIIFELSLPRSNSTAWQIAISEAPEIHGQINEPSFHPDVKGRRHNEPFKSDAGERSFDEYCKRILDRLEMLFSGTSTRPIGLVVNDISHSLRTDELTAILKLSNKIAVTIRNPMSQLASVLTRVVNDSLVGYDSANLSTQKVLSLVKQEMFLDKEIAELIGVGKEKINPNWILSKLSLPKETPFTAKILKRAIDLAINHCISQHLDICWDNLDQHFETIKNYRPHPSLIIIDGSDLVKDPETIMKKSSSGLKLTYTKNMIDHWQKANKDNFYCCITANLGKEQAMQNAWNGPVRNSTQLEQKPESIKDCPSLQDFPTIMHPKLKSAMKIYRKMCSQKEKLEVNVENNSLLFLHVTTKGKAKKLLLEVPRRSSRLSEKSKNKKQRQCIVCAI